MISQKSVQEILDTAKIEDVVEDYVNLKRRGVNMIGLCPFHNEKTPSFTVSPAKNIFKCFGCGKGGNPVQFLMEHDSLTFPEALRYLAKKYGIELEETVTSRETIEERQMMDSLFLVNEFARNFWQDQLFNTDMGKSVGLSYFKQRGFREETIKKFGLGFAPEKKDAFTLKAINTGYNIDLLRKLGLTSRYDSDFFRNRVMFTIHNLSGKVIAFGGRILDTNIKAPKYINSPETEIYTKNKVLYGAYFAKGEMRKKNECIMVEGYTDVISLHQAGFENVVASSGTSLTEGQIRLVKRYTPNIKIIYDGDTAGVKAALRGLDLVLAQDMNVKVVLLPEGEDPDSYLKSVGSTAFEEYIDKEAKDFILFKADLLMKDAEGDPVKKTEVTRDIINSIAYIPDTMKRSLYIKQCADVTKIDEQILVEEVSKQVVHIQRKLRSNEERERRQRQRQAQRNSTKNTNTNFPTVPSGDPNFPSEEPNYIPEGEEGTAYDIPVEQGQPSQSSNRKAGAEFQEEHIINILINFGSEIYDKEDNTTVAEFILGNIEDVLDEFDNKNYEKIAKLYHQKLLAEEAVNDRFFFNHTDQEISKIAIDLSASPYELSKNWVDMHGIEMQSQKKFELNFTEDSTDALLRFKLKKVIRLLDRQQTKLKDMDSSTDPTQLMMQMKTVQKLLSMRNDLAQKLRIVILK